MLIQLESSNSVPPSRKELSMTQTSQLIVKQVLSTFNIPEGIHVNLLQQYSERYKLAQAQIHKIKSKSVASYSNSNKKQTEVVKQLLQLPSNLRIQSTSIDKGHSRSFLLKTKNSAKFYNKLPKIPKMTLFQQAISQAKVQFTKNRQKILQQQSDPNRLKIQSRGIQLKSFVSQQTHTIITTKLQKPSLKPLIPNHTVSPQVMMSLRKISTSKTLSKKISQNLNNKDNLNRTQIPLKSIVIKYKKGYIIYDQRCQFAYKHRHEAQQPNIKLPTTLPRISAKDYCILNINTLKPIFMNKMNRHPIQIASLTKMVTCLLTILVCKKYQIDPMDYKCRISEQASSMVGTSAQLQAGDVLTIDDLLYGLMLPSGNDAAVGLAQNIGRIIQRKKKIQNSCNPINTFIKQMNVLYQQLVNQQEQQQHVFKNPSGLTWNPNVTTVQQIGIFAAVACKNQYFSKIVNTKVFELNIMNQRYGIARKMQWKNTNKLLWKGWEGVKTGTTENAGHCFVGKQGNYIFALLDCSTLQKRFSDAQTLRKWMHLQQQDHKSY